MKKKKMAGARAAVNQSELKVKLCNRCQARENTRVAQFTIGFGFNWARKHVCSY